MLVHLPNEIIINILYKIYYSDIINLHFTCIFFYKFIKQNSYLLYNNLLTYSLYSNLHFIQKQNFNFNIFYNNYCELIIKKKKSIIIIKIIYNYLFNILQSKLKPQYTYIDYKKLIETLTINLNILDNINFKKYWYELSFNRFPCYVYTKPKINTIIITRALINKLLKKKYLDYKIPDDLICINIGILNYNSKSFIDDVNNPYIYNYNLENNKLVYNEYKIKITKNDFLIFNI